MNCSSFTGVGTVAVPGVVGDESSTDKDDNEDDRIVDEVEEEEHEKEAVSVAAAADSDRRGDFVKDEVVAVFFTLVAVAGEVDVSAPSALNDDASKCRL
jgi:uncharacterized protein YabN with tetrapyrrole methylase and pyrophosphatase domain